MLSHRGSPEMLRSLCVALVVALMTACSARVDGPSVRVKPPTVEIGPDNGGDFCPPGQAKKGRC